MEIRENPVLKKMLARLDDSLGERLVGVVLYGSAARGDYVKQTSDFNLLIVLRDLEPETLTALSEPVRDWERQRQPAPRLFTEQLIAESADVFPIEFLDIVQARLLLHGTDPFDRFVVHPDHLRLQCERELREKMMRLREGFIEVHDKPRKLTRLLTDSYSTFVALFRGCLHLMGGTVPVHNDEVVATFCERAGIERGPFDEVGLLKQGRSVDEPPATLFARYYAELTRAVGAVDRFAQQEGGPSK